MADSAAAMMSMKDLLVSPSRRATDNGSMAAVLAVSSTWNADLEAPVALALAVAVAVVAVLAAATTITTIAAVALDRDRIKKSLGYLLLEPITTP